MASIQRVSLVALALPLFLLENFLGAFTSLQCSKLSGSTSFYDDKSLWVLQKKRALPWFAIPTSREL
jgi:hypothetical protein